MTNQTKAPVLAAPAAQLEFPAASPLRTLNQRVGLTDIEISYSRPGAKGREIFGGLVPYDKLWRTGANQASKISFSTAVKLNGAEVGAGSYSLFSIPGKDEWTVIINKDTEQAGTGKYDEKSDVVRLKVKPVSLNNSVDNFAIELDPISDESASLDIVWEKTKISIKVQVDFVEDLVSQVEAVMASDDPKKPYLQAALFYFNHDRDLHKASQWVDAAIAERQVYPFYFIKARILAKLNDKKGAVSAAKESHELAIKAGETGFATMVEKFISALA